jgi:hypothetical protein
MAHKVPFLVAELGPDVDPFVLHLFAALAEKEREGARDGLHVARKSAVEVVKAEADRYAANVLPIIGEAQKAGANTLRPIFNTMR